MGPNLACPRDVRNFVEAKRIRREPIRLRAHGAAVASQMPRNQRDVYDMLNALRMSGDFWGPGEKIAELYRAVRLRVEAVPLPREICQNEDKSVSIDWGGIMVRFGREGIAYNIDGARKVSREGDPRLLVEALALRSRMTWQAF